MRKSLRQRIEEERRSEFKGVTFNSIEDLYLLLVDGDRPKEDRQANPTQWKFWRDPSFAKSYGGPAGCAKTSTAVAEIIVRALFEPGSKMLIARNDYNDLKDTTRLRFDEMIARLPAGTVVDKSEAAPAKVWIQPVVRSKEQPDALSVFTFMGLTGDFGSYEFTGAVVDEADECEENQIEKIRTRLRHKRGTRYMGICFNPPDKNHWLYTACTGLDARDEKVKDPTFSHHRPHPRENARNLPDNYYDLMADLPEELRQRLRDGEWGTTFPGQPVLRAFNRKVHTARLTYKGGTVFRFWDFGFNRPYCCWCQITVDGRIEVMREYLGHYMEVEQFAADVKRKSAEWFPNAPAYKDYGDPAVAQKKDTGQALAILTKAGITIMYQHTPLDLSLRVVRSLLEKLVGGVPAVLIDSRECPVLVGACAGGYHFKEDGTTPKKDGYYDHPVDAFRYGVWNVFGAAQTTHSTLPDSVAYWSR